MEDILNELIIICKDAIYEYGFWVLDLDGVGKAHVLNYSDVIELAMDESAYAYAECIDLDHRFWANLADSLLKYQDTIVTPWIDDHGDEQLVIEETWWHWLIEEVAILTREQF